MPVYNDFFDDAEISSQWRPWFIKMKIFATFSYAKYVIDVIFHQRNRPSVNMQNKKVYYSGKNKVYGLNL